MGELITAYHNYYDECNYDKVKFVVMVRTVPKFQKLMFGSALKLKQFKLTATVQDKVATAAGELAVSYNVVMECLIRGGGLKFANPPKLKTSELREHYGETKGTTSYAITADSSAQIDEFAHKLETSRSEVLESAIRHGALEVAKKYYLRTFG